MGVGFGCGELWCGVLLCFGLCVLVWLRLAVLGLCGFAGFVVAVALFFVLLVLCLVVGAVIALVCRLGFGFKCCSC